MIQGGVITWERWLSSAEDNLRRAFSCKLSVAATGRIVSPKDVEVLTPDTCELDLIWKRVFADDQVKMKSSG